MKFEVNNFSILRMSSSDITKSKYWYSQFFSMEPKEEESGFVSFDIAGTTFEIVSEDEKSPKSTGGSVGYWYVTGFEAAIEKAVSLGGQVYRGPIDVDVIQKKMAQIVDPQGNVFGLIGDLK